MEIRRPRLHGSALPAAQRLQVSEKTGSPSKAVSRASQRPGYLEQGGEVVSGREERGESGEWRVESGEWRSGVVGVKGGKLEARNSYKWRKSWY